MDYHKINIQYLDVEALTINQANARAHSPRQIKSLAKSIESFGFNVPLVVDSNNHIICGHARLEAAKKVKFKQVPVIYLHHLTSNQIKAFSIADNRLSEMSSWDETLLATQLKELSELDLSFDIEATGFTVGEIDLRIEGLDAPKDADDELPFIKEGVPVTQHGDLWLLGEHKLYCGNSQDENSFEYLMNDKHAGMVVIDPPYNVKVDGHVGGKGKIKHREFEMASGEMSSAEFTGFLQNTFDLLVKFSKGGSVHTIFMDWRHLPEILEAGKSAYSAMLNMCVWVKNQAGMGSLYRSQHELALIYRNGNTPHQNNVQLGRFGRYRTNVWQYGGIQTMRHGEEGDLLAAHPTVKPIQMIADAILDCSKPRDIVLDCFLGSGTTLLAAERVGRLCYAMELDPLYVDTAILRWQQMTGLDAIDAVTGQTYTQRLQQAESAKRLLMAKQDKSVQTEYEVGYKKPPKSTRFVKGQSGNPTGRHGGKKNWATILNEALKEKVTIVENGQKRQVTKLDAAIKQLINQAATGDKASMRHLMQLVPSMEAIVTKAGISPLSNEQDRVVLEAMLKRMGNAQIIEIKPMNGSEGNA